MADNSIHFNDFHKKIFLKSGGVVSLHNKQEVHSWLLNTKRDLSSLTEYINSVAYPIFAACTDDDSNNGAFSHDVRKHGLSGLTVITYPEAQGGSKYGPDCYWVQGNGTGRATTIKETFDCVLGRLTKLEQEIESPEDVNLDDINADLVCHDIKIRSLALNTFGASCFYPLVCDENAQQIRAWPLAFHIRKLFETIFPNTNWGANGLDLAFGDYSDVNCVLDAYPALSFDVGNAWTQVFLDGAAGPSAVSPTDILRLKSGNDISLSHDVNTNEIIIDSLAGGEANQNAFTTIRTDAGIDVVADTTVDTLDIKGSTGITTTGSEVGGVDTVFVSLDASLDDLNNTSVAAPQDGDILSWDTNNGNWIPITPSAAGDINELSFKFIDTDIGQQLAADSTTDLLSFSGDNGIQTDSVNVGNTDGVIVRLTAGLDHLSDVSTPAPNNGDHLSWDAGTNKWVPAAPVGGGSLENRKKLAWLTNEDFTGGDELGTFAVHTTVNKATIGELNWRAVTNLVIDDNPAGTPNFVGDMVNTDVGQTPPDSVELNGVAYAYVSATNSEKDASGFALGHRNGIILGAENGLEFEYYLRVPTSPFGNGGGTAGSGGGSYTDVHAWAGLQGEFLEEDGTAGIEDRFFRPGFGKISQESFIGVELRKDINDGVIKWFGRCIDSSGEVVVKLTDAINALDILSDGLWHRWTVKRTAVAVDFYLDGVQLATSITTNIPSSDLGGPAGSINTTTGLNPVVGVSPALSPSEESCVILCDYFQMSKLVSR